ncbi:MAG: hypothetical protein WCS36_06690, partial [Candidatus Neomarinimicrobiota bacterium]
ADRRLWSSHGRRDGGHNTKWVQISQPSAESIILYALIDGVFISIDSWIYLILVLFHCVRQTNFA